MKKIHYNKLIRDKIPEKIKNKGSDCRVRILEDEEFEQELLKKVGEEGSGLEAAESKQEIIEELADVLDVIDEIKKIKGITDVDIRAAQKKAYEKKGGFNEKIFLEWSSDDGYKTNERRYKESS